jgi:serine/threonine protein kinase
MKHRPSPPSRYKKTTQTPKPGANCIVEVWHDSMLDRNVAIKWLTSSDGEEQLLNECKVLAEAMFPHVVEIYELIFDRHGTLHGIVMEYVDGGTLAEVDVPTDKNKALEVVRLLYQFAVGLHSLHEVSIIHRDVKPENAVVSSPGRLKIIDFGISAQQDATTTLRARATMGYAAPELFHRPAVVTAKSDVYSFGMLCWKLLAGTLPAVGAKGFPDASHYPLMSLGSQTLLPTRVLPVLDGCLAWEPTDRPAMGEVAKALHDELTRGRHEATVALSTGVFVLNKAKPKTKIKALTGSLQVAYDGYDFKVEQADGEVFVNNSAVKVGDVLTEGCLLTFGEPSRGMTRAYAPFRKFSPEVVI